MPLVKLWVHLIWSTKNRQKLIDKQLIPKLISHIKDNAKQKEIYIDRINCVSDHIHILVSLNKEHSISKIMNLIKGESSYWVNKNKLTKGKFEWQDEYIAISISESVVGKVREYIDNQEEHHKVRTFDEEYKLFIKRYGFEKLTG